MPDIFFETLDSVPEAFRDIAEEKDGKVAINVVANSKLKEFRDNNIKVSTERDELAKKVAALTSILGEDVDADEFASELAELRDTAQKVKDGKLKADGDIAKEVEARVAAMRSDYEKRLQEAGKEASAWKDKAGVSESKYKRSLVDRAVTDAAVAEGSGVETKALPDILERARKVFQVDEEGKLIAKDGEATIYGGDGSTPMTPKEWLEKLKGDAPYFFKQSNGGGAGGNTDGKLPGGMSQEEWDKLPAKKKLEYANKAHPLPKRT